MQKIRVFEQRGKRYYSLGIPVEIGRRLPEDVVYECELTDDGLLFRPVKTKPPPRPRWAERKK